MNLSSVRSLTRVASAYTRAAADSRPTVAYVGGWLGKSNLGDEALVPAMQELFPQFALYPFAGGRLARAALFGLPGIKAGILAGGTLIAQKAYWLEIAEQFLARSKRMIVFGTGVEDPEFWPGETTLETWRPVLERCSFLGVRGPISAEALRQAGFSAVEMVGDPVVAFAQDEICRDPAERRLGLNIGTADGRVHGGEQRLTDEIVRLARIARGEGWTVEWFVVWPKDLAPTLRAASLSQTAGAVHLVYRDHRAFIDRARRLTLFAGMKLHATVLATCALTPSLMIEYRPKCRDYMESIGQGAANVRADRFRAAAAWDTLLEWSARREQQAEILAQGIRRLRLHQQHLARAVAASAMS